MLCYTNTLDSFILPLIEVNFLVHFMDLWDDENKKKMQELFLCMQFNACER